MQEEPLWIAQYEPCPWNWP